MFILQVVAYNSEGKSNPSQVVEFITNPDRPGSPCRPVIRGRVLPTSFKMVWGEHHLTPTLFLVQNPTPSLDVVNKVKKSVYHYFFLELVLTIDEVDDITGTPLLNVSVEPPPPNHF